MPEPMLTDPLAVERRIQDDAWAEWQDRGFVGRADQLQAIIAKHRARAAFERRGGPVRAVPSSRSPLVPVYVRDLEPVTGHPWRYLLWAAVGALVVAGLTAVDMLSP